jgi:hypothetical protein
LLNIENEITVFTREAWRRWRRQRSTAAAVVPWEARTGRDRDGTERGTL